MNLESPFRRTSEPWCTVGSLPRKLETTLFVGSVHKTKEPYIDPWRNLQIESVSGFLGMLMTLGSKTSRSILREVHGA